MQEGPTMAARKMGKQLLGGNATRQMNSARPKRLCLACILAMLLMALSSACDAALNADNLTATSQSESRATSAAATSTSQAAAWATSTAAASLPELAAAACTGQAVIRAGDYSDADSRHLILIATERGNVHAWNDEIPDVWKPDVVGEVQLVACVYPETEDSIEECVYLGPNITRYRYQQLVQVVVASTGDIIAERVFQGEPPRNCRQTEPYDLTILRGEHVEYGDIFGWLAEIVTGSARTPMDEGDQQPLGQPVLLYVSVLEDERVVSANADIVLTISWTATSEAYVEDFLNAASTSLEIDGAEIANPGDYWSPPVQREEDFDEDGENDFASNWRYPLGTLEPGTHTIIMTISLAYPVTDGYDFDGDGYEDYYSEPIRGDLTLISE